MTSEPAARRALCFGEALIDQFPDRRVVAGAPLHVAARLASFGWHAYLVTRVGQDDDGLRIAETLRRHGVDDSLVEVDGELRTGVTTIELDGRSHRFTIEYPAAWDAIAGPDPAPSHHVLYFGTLALRDDRSRAAWQRMVETSPAFKVTDVNLRPPYVDREAVAAVTSAADLIKLSDAELDDTTDLLGLPNRPGALFAEGAEWVCVTHGASGAELWHRDGGHWEAAGIEADVIDTVGAGDAFTAAIVDSLLSGDDGGEAVERANRHAAATVTRRGGLPDPVEGGPPRSRVVP